MLVGRTFLHNCLSVKLTDATDSCHLVWNPWWKRGAGKLLSELTSKIGCSGDTTSEADLCSKGSLILPGSIWMKSRKSNANHVDIFGEEFTRHWDCVPGKGVLWRENRKFTLCIILGFESSASIRESYFVYLPQLRCHVERAGWTINQKLSVGKLQLPNPSQTKLQIRVNVNGKRFSPTTSCFPAGSTILSPEIDWYPAESHFYDIFGPFTSTRALTLQILPRIESMEGYIPKLGFKHFLSKKTGKCNSKSENYNLFDLFLLIFHILILSNE